MNAPGPDESLGASDLAFGAAIVRERTPTENKNKLDQGTSVSAEIPLNDRNP